MSVTLNTQLENLMFSSQIPDLDLTTSDDIWFRLTPN